MSIQLTKTDLASLEARLDKRFDNLATIMSHFANDVQSKLAEHDEEFRKINDKYDHLINTIDRFVGRIDTYETELAARDHKIERLERWIQQIAAKTQVELN
jgi:chromosome segregation ATPase